MRKRLLDTALELFIERGIEGVSLDAIVAGAGVAKGSLYRYFPGREQIVRALFEPYEAEHTRWFDDLVPQALEARTQRELVRVYRRIAESFAAVVATMPRRALLYIQENGAPGFGARRALQDLKGMLFGTLPKLALHEQQIGVARRHGVAHATHILVGGVERLVVAALEAEGPVDEEGLTDAIYWMAIANIPDVEGDEAS